MLIRQAVGRDADGIAAVHVAAWQVAYAGLIEAEELARRSDPERRRRFWRQAVAHWPPAERPLLVAVGAADDVLGFAAGRLLPAGTTDFDAEVEALYVHPEAWGGGAGTALLRAMAGRFLAGGAESAYLWCLAGNRQACGFYRRLGGRRVDRGTEKAGEQALPTVAFAWKPLALLAAAGHSGDHGCEDRD